MMNMYQNMGNLLALQWYLVSDANILHNLLANRGCHRAERLDIIMAETFEYLNQSFWTGMYELLKNQQWGGIVLKESVAFQCTRSSNSRKKKARTFFAKP
jgi:hypothetical protein